MIDKSPIFKKPASETFYFDRWAFVPSQNVLTDTKEKSSNRLEPKVGLLLKMLLKANGSVVTKEQLIAAIWPDTIVSNDTLAKTISRLRAELSDPASDPKFIETIPKIGYRLLVTQHSRTSFINKRVATTFCLCALFISVIAFFYLNQPSKNGAEEVTSKLARAEQLYMRYNNSDNKAALTLYEEVLEDHPENIEAMAGMANALLQQVVRWPDSEQNEGISLSTALSNGQLTSPSAQITIAKATAIAENANQLSPNNVSALKALALAHSAQGKIDSATEIYSQIADLDETAWRSLLNLSELYQYSQQHGKAMQTFEAAFFAMQFSFEREPYHVVKWQPLVGITLARWHQSLGEEKSTQEWAQRVLEVVPYQPEASAILVDSLLRDGKRNKVAEFCNNYLKSNKSLTKCSEI